MRLAGLSLVYNEEPLVKGCIESLKPFVDQHLIMVSEVPYFGEAEPVDKTYELCVEHGAEPIMGVWPMDHDQRNTGIAMLQDYDWILITDVDMWYEKKDLEELISRLDKIPNDAVIMSQHGYFKDVDHVLEGDGFRPVVAIRPTVRFTYIGNVNVPCYVIDDIKVHHLAWCEPKDIYKKVTTYPHAPEFDGRKWYFNEYINWTEGKNVKMPNGEEFGVIRQELPEELKAYLK